MQESSLGSPDYLPPSAAPSKFLSATGGGGAYAAGGGGGIEGSVFQAAGGVGGGGMGAGPNVPRPAQAGFSFGSGGGGGAGAYPYPEARGGNGADGAVMVRYETGQVALQLEQQQSGGNVNGLEPGNGISIIHLPVMEPLPSPRWRNRSINCCCWWFYSSSSVLCWSWWWRRWRYSPWWIYYCSWILPSCNWTWCRRWRS